MNKTEVALQYFPDANPCDARRQLRRWIAQCAPLIEDLRKTGYVSSQKHLTIRQVRIIYAHLGEPDG